MKSFAFICILSVLLTVALSQRPIPIPNFEAKKLEGQWNVMWAFNEKWNSDMDFSECNLWDIKFDSQNTGDIAIEAAGWGFSLPFTVTNSSAVWTYFGANENFTIVAMDPNYQWFSIGSVESGMLNNGAVLSRSANISKTILNSQVLLLKAEGFPINASNQNFYSNLNNQSCLE